MRQPLKIACIGNAETWRDAPFGDPAWTIWAHTSCQAKRLPRVDVWFDVHRVEIWRRGKAWYTPEDGHATYVDWLAARDVPVVMQAQYPIIQTSRAYPLREIVEAFEIVPFAWGLTPDDPRWWGFVKDRGDFSSTFAYMLALALYQGADEIAMYGIDFSRKVHPRFGEDVQRAGAKYWVGLARGLGVPVTVARGSWFEEQETLYGYGVPELVHA